MAEEKYSIHLDNFDGPLDLLLHLIDKNKLDIYDIPIAVVTEQYMAYLAEAEQMNLEIASEFLLIAATLIDIKAKMLLPKKTFIEPDEPDPREDLVNRLLEYKFYKEMAGILRENAQQNGDFLTREVDIAALSKDFTPINPVENISVEQLCQAFQNVLVHIKEEPPVIQLEREEYDVEEMMEGLLAELDRQKSLKFQDLFKPHDSKRKVITMFLALLELLKLNKILIKQQQNFALLWIFSTKQAGKESRDEASAIF